MRQLISLLLVTFLAGCAPGEKSTPAPPSRPTPAPATDLRSLPADANVINVRDHGAKGDGVTDDTAAIQSAIRAGMERGRYATPGFVYLPKGTYRVTGPLESKAEPHGWSGGWRSGMILWGESQTATIIKLQDRHPDYADPAKPRAVIATGSESDKRTQAGDPPLSGGGNRAFRHGILHLTVDTGAGNPGAVGIDFVCSNRGTIERVTIRSTDPDRVGRCGLSLERNWPGPGLVKHVRIEGFDHAIRTSHGQYSMTFEHLEFVGQRVAGTTDSYHQALFFRDLRSDSAGPGIHAPGERALTVLVDSQFKGGATNTAAVRGKTILLARDVAVAGYGAALDRGDGKPSEASFGAEFASPPPLRFGDGTPLAALAVAETPEYWTNEHAQWANVTAFGATPNQGDDDDTDGIQAAIDSGQPVVYLPNGAYQIRRTLIVRGKVRLIIGMQSSIGAPKDASVEPLVQIGAGDGPVTLEHLWISGVLEHDATRAAAVRHVDLKDGYRNTARGTGDMFIEDMIGKPVLVLHPQRLFARQLNCEFGENPLVENHGGDMWLLGYKTEGQMTCLKNVGGRVELLGGLFYPLRAVPDEVPLFINDGGQMRLTYVMNGGNYPLHVTQRAAGAAEWRHLTSREVPGRGPALLLASP